MFEHQRFPGSNALGKLARHEDRNTVDSLHIYQDQLAHNIDSRAVKQSRVSSCNNTFP